MTSVPPRREAALSYRLSARDFQDGGRVAPTQVEISWKYPTPQVRRRLPTDWTWMLPLSLFLLIARLPSAITEGFLSEAHLNRCGIGLPSGPKPRLNRTLSSENQASDEQVSPFSL